MSYQTIQMRIAHYRQLKARFERKGNAIQLSYTQKSISELERRLRALSMGAV
ncbi:hypothetical protein [Aliidiomarina quisquiliarum]|uniref:hypothetical protein n=1 Tax=Aliidiomarina quisquiliarum TaxID=2938947 RepID=UPI00208FAC50|nr:hypothetical protein [Aliidiomarina quisquiliarum]MCO4320008.1 hypothetical protein [Aliidiomarina quisquiliarum]